MKKRSWQFNWKITFFTGLFLPLFIVLGFWQLQRADEKTHIEQQANTRLVLPPQSVEEVDENQLPERLAFLSVSVSGSLDNEHVFFLDNRVHQGKAGFEIINAVQTAQGRVYLINRGWIAANATREKMPEVKPIHGMVTLQGHLYVPTGKTFVLKEATLSNRWPQIISDINVTHMATLLQKPIFPYTIRVSQELNDGLIRQWPVVNMSPTKHIAYAAQWFGMAIALFILFIVSTFKKNHEER